MLTKDNPRDKLIQLLDERRLNAHQLARDLLGYLSWDECRDFAQMNDIPLEDDEPEEELDEDDTDNEQTN